MRQVFTLSLALVAILAVCSCADEDTHVYKKGETIKVYASKIGPLNNPHETYDFFDMPGCPRMSDEMRPQTLAQALTGDELYPLITSITFGEDQSNKPLCTFKPTADQLKQWEQMVQEQYSYKLTIDDLPVWALYGQEEKGQLSIYQHRSFYISSNQGQIVKVSVKLGKLTPIEADHEYYFTYSARFFATEEKFENRYAHYVDEKALQPRVRWFSIINSTLIVIFLVTVVLIIISRTLKADFAKMDEERRLRYEGHDAFDDSGWKQLHADVFRVPTCPALLSAIIGSGIQLLVLLMLGIVVGAVVSTDPNVSRNLSGFAVVMYAITSFIGGYVSSASFARFSILSPSMSRHWTRCLGLTQILLPGVFFASTLVTNTLASLYGSAQVIHFGTLLILFSLWLFLSCPLSMAGTFIGRYLNRRSKRREVPHINQIPRLIPKSRRLVTSPWMLFLLSGVLPLISIFMELYLVFNSFWLYRSYQVYGFLTLALLIYCIVTVCVSIAAVFVLLSTENHLWQWMSISFGASCALYVFLYAIYFYFFKTKMHGLFMFTFYFSYSAFFAGVLACIGGSIAYLAAETFVQKIYTQAKRD